MATKTLQATQAKFDEISNDGRLLYRYLRGSHLYGTNVETSDEDTAGVFVSPLNDFLGLQRNYWDQVNDEKCDNVWYEVGKYAKLLLTSNPTVLESLFAPKHCVYYEHPLYTELKDFRDIFITKKCFAPLGSYSVSQLHKMRGLNKKIVNPVTERRGILSFCYTFYNQGSTEIENWLEYRGFEQKYCGLVNIPNMHDVYGCYYDWGQYWQDKGITMDTYQKISGMKVRKSSDIVADIKSGNGNEEVLRQELWESQLYNQLMFIIEKYGLMCEDRGGEYWGDTMSNVSDWFEKHKTPIGYRGLIKEGEGITTTELRLSSVSKGEMPICWISYNEHGFSKHCIDYKNYKEWERNRNPVRYQSNLNKNYDAKNASHCMRLINMCIEAASGQGFNVDRRDIDRQLLLDIKNHKFEYDELMNMLDERKQIMDKAIAESTLPDDIDSDILDQWLIKVRRTFDKH